MLVSLIVGSFVITACVFIQIFGVIELSSRVKALARFGGHISVHYKKMWLMVATVLGIFGIHAFQIWVWAFTYWLIDALPDFHMSLYFSTVTFSTLGYGDVILSPDWRILGALEGIAGFIHIGWSTAYLITASTRYGPFTEGDHF
ncbi:MAG: potassium channel family protein [Cohaesibacter sp.]|nr:potassium channel family protein [Cohaesibacter sp.]MCV6577020.1 potassium channel family protein [Cohaesibacter sp.]MCV6601953.1 potassium channel family protein [Cohaesibacter sp.]